MRRLITALTEIQILDVRVWVEDSTIVSALSIYGEVMGKIRHGQVLTKSGMLIATGVRFSSFKKKNLIHLPSYVKTGNNNFRVRYDGQPETCRLCNQQGHFAAACPAKSRTHSHPKGRPTTGTVTPMPGAYLTKWTNSHPLSANLPFNHHLLQFRKPGLIQQKKMVCTTCQTTLHTAKTEMAMAKEWPCTSLTQPPTSAWTSA